MVRKIALGKPVCKGFWDPWQVQREKLGKPPKRPKPAERCVICLSEIEEGAPSVECPHCGNIMHRNCVEEWVKVKGEICPICKRPISLDYT